MDNLLVKMALVVGAIMIVIFIYDLMKSRELTERDRAILLAMCIKHINDRYPLLLDTFQIDDCRFLKSGKSVVGTLTLECFPRKMARFIIEKKGYGDFIIKEVKDNEISEYRKEDGDCN